MGVDFATALEAYAQALTQTFASATPFAPEDQLKEPVQHLLQSAGEVLGLKVETHTEVKAKEVGGRPDIGIEVDGLLVGFVELKAPGKGANPARFKGADREQWEKFRNLPNLIYTDGSNWALYRTGERVGKMVRLSGDVTSEGADAVDPADAEALLALLSDFLHWEPLVPTSPRALAHALAPLCRLLRSDVLEALQTPGSYISSVASEWRKYFFPDADDFQFADAYAQTLTYTLLLARLDDPEHALSVAQAAKAIYNEHPLLSNALVILGHVEACKEIATSLDLLERVIGAVDAVALRRKSRGDPWLYFYEDFLAVYDPRLRKDRGVYYTPVEVVQAQVRLVAQLLEERLGADLAFAEKNVLTLDPAAGTGTYLLAALEYGLDRVAEVKGPGMRASAATRMAENLYGFELLVGPYTVAHLRLTGRVTAEGGQLPKDGLHIYLADTLESPNRPARQFPSIYKQLALEHERARRVKREVPILVCLGNPPYDRQQLPMEEQKAKRKGGWVRYGDPGDKKQKRHILLQDFLEPLERLGLGVHAKNLYNDYVYFWRWALWKVFEAKGGPGIVSFITASSYLRGPGFAGMREVMRRTFDELWIIDLEGDNLGARKTENVFAIRTPVAIAIGVRYGDPQPDTPAAVHYTRISGTREEKLATLKAVRRFEDLKWRPTLPGWHDPFLPTSDKPYWDWPLLTELFPWQTSGVQFKRTWPIGPTREVLERRWARLLQAPREERRLLMRETASRTVDRPAVDLFDTSVDLPSLAKVPPGTPPHRLVRYGYRSFDRQWALLDDRLCDRPRPALLRAHSDRQVYLTSLLTDVLGEGPAAVATVPIPDLHHFCGRGAKDVIPLWLDREATRPNVTGGVLDVLSEAYGREVAPEDFFAYAYAVLFTPRYVRRFWDELTIPGPRLPITRDGDLFARAVALGRRLLWLHTFGERFVPPGEKPGKVPPAAPKCLAATPSAPDKYPETFGYDAAAQELRVGEGGRFGPVRPEIWEFSVSGLQVVRSWLRYRMRRPAGRKSSPLDEILPTSWTFDDELLTLLWVLDHTLDLLPRVDRVFEEIVKGDLFTTEDFPLPKAEERKGWRRKPLFEERGEC
ncbi:MAG TPA: DNA methyltransferase [Chloroflexi bacterium]|nr:DNA methyltransferase [Chloroflexota bacterium]